jgi:tRNA1Val (adenine37-N6)-methyltransferase
MKPFHFKQFSIEQDQCAMKVTLDACVLGAYCRVEKSSRILDIGCGTGLLSLMVAQRCDAAIDAIELDPGAAQQAQSNFNNSCFSRRLNLIQSDIKHYSANSKYDLIVCNPPFFSDHLKGTDSLRNQARHNDGLSFFDLLTAVKQHLDEHGSAWFILPSHEFSGFIQTAKNIGFHLRLQLALKSRKDKSPHRMIFSLCLSPISTIEEETLTIHGPGNEYSEDFRKLLSPYYLKL